MDGLQTNDRFETSTMSSFPQLPMHQESVQQIRCSSPLAVRSWICLKTYYQPNFPRSTWAGEVLRRGFRVNPFAHGFERSLTRVRDFSNDGADPVEACFEADAMMVICARSMVSRKSSFFSWEQLS